MFLRDLRGEKSQSRLDFNQILDEFNVIFDDFIEILDDFNVILDEFNETLDEFNEIFDDFNEIFDDFMPPVLRPNNILDEFSQIFLLANAGTLGNNTASVVTRRKRKVQSAKWENAE